MQSGFFIYWITAVILFYWSYPRPIAAIAAGLLYLVASANKFALPPNTKAPNYR